MLSRKTLAIIFAAAAALPFAADGVRRLQIHDQDVGRQHLFTRAEAYNMTTEHLRNHNAISQETYQQRKGYYAACFDENERYSTIVQSRDWASILVEREVFMQTCTMPAPKL